jgi:hypothetical protein
MAYRDDYEALRERVSILERELAATREQERELRALRDENARLRAEIQQLRPEPGARGAQTTPGADPAEELFQSYLRVIGAIDTNEEDLSEEDQALVGRVEEAHGVAAGDQKEFRKNLLNYQGALRIEGRQVACKQLFPELYRHLARLLGG